MHPQLSMTPRKLPIFVFPQSLNFYVDDQTTHKLILTLYNPYDFPVKFKVFCTSPNKYIVVDPEGTIKSKCCVDIVVRHVAISISNCSIDKFRIQMQEYPTKQIIGKRDVEARLLPGVPDSSDRITPDPEVFQQLPTNSTGQNPQSYAVINNRDSARRGGEINWVIIVIGIICITGLVLPTKGDEYNYIPDCFHLTLNAKLVLTFVLGMVTSKLLRIQ